MKFVYTYREKDGSRVSRELEASDRRAAFDKLAQMRITVISLREGALPKQGAARSGFFRNAAKILAAVVLVGCVAWMLATFFSSEKKHSATATLEQKSRSMPDSAGKGIASDFAEDIKTGAKQTRSPAAKPAVHRKSARTESDVDSLSGKTNSVADPNDGPDMIARGASDQVLEMMTAFESGEDAPPLPNGAFSEKDFRASLKKPIVINENDPETVKDAKTRIIEARKELLEMLNKGWTVESVLAEHEKLSAENRNVRNDTIRDLNAIIATGDLDAAVKYRDVVNESLRQMGIAEIDTAITEEEKELQREARRERLAARIAEKRAQKLSAEKNGKK